jgi:hypothetical protein
LDISEVKARVNSIRTKISPSTVKSLVNEELIVGKSKSKTGILMEIITSIKKKDDATKVGGSQFEEDGIPTLS